MYYSAAKYFAYLGPTPFVVTCILCHPGAYACHVVCTTVTPPYRTGVDPFFPRTSAPVVSAFHTTKHERLQKTPRVIHIFPSYVWLCAVPLRAAGCEGRKRATCGTEHRTVPLCTLSIQRNVKRIRPACCFTACTVDECPSKWVAHPLKLLHFRLALNMPQFCDKNS